VCLGLTGSRSGSLSYNDKENGKIITGKMSAYSDAADFKNDFAKN
jgi:hypothetical protein